MTRVTIVTLVPNISLFWRQYADEGLIRAWLALSLVSGFENSVNNELALTRTTRTAPITRRRQLTVKLIVAAKLLKPEVLRIISALQSTRAAPAMVSTCCRFIALRAMRARPKMISVGAITCVARL
jgi:hypothetical protein